MNTNLYDLYDLAAALISREIELTDSLPTFGGDEPVNTERVWSWDETRLLIGTCADDLQIIAREDAEEYL